MVRCDKSPIAPASLEIEKAKETVAHIVTMMS